MDILLTRYRHTRWGLDGYITINGVRIADTVEHPDNHLQPGTYPVTLKQMPFMPRCGPFGKKAKKKICVGRCTCSGCVINTKTIFNTLYSRIQKSRKRGHEVKLIIH